MKAIEKQQRPERKRKSAQRGVLPPGDREKELLNYATAALHSPQHWVHDEHSLTIHNETTRKRVKALELISWCLFILMIPVWSYTTPQLGAVMFALAFMVALAARCMRWWDHA